MKWLRPGPPPFQTDLAMIGAKAGQQVLMLGAGEGGLAAALSGVTGLNGRTLVIDPAEDGRAIVERAAADAGALIDFEQAPLAHAPIDAGSFDIVVVLNGMSRAGGEAAAVAAAAARALRPGGRVVAIEGTTASGFLSSLRKKSAATPLGGDTVRDLLAGAGLRAARILGEADGITYIEASKPRA